MKNKYRFLSILFFSLIFCNSFAQSSSRFNIDISLNANIVARDQFSYFIINDDTEIIYNQDAEIKFLPALSLYYSLSNRTSLLTGLHLYDFGHTSERLQIFPVSPSKLSTHTYRAYFLSIPVGVDYKFINRKFKSSFFTSILTDVYLNEESNEPEFDLIDSFDWNRINLSVQAGLGFEYSIAGSLNLSLRPYLTAPLQDYVDKDGPANVRDIKPFRLGVTFGVKYQL